MKRIWLCIAGVVALFLGIGAFALSRVDTSFVMRKVADATREATGGALVFQSTPSISFFPPGVRFAGASWGEPGSGLAVTVRKGVVQLELIPLLSGNVVIKEIRLDGPDVAIDAAKTVPAAQADGGRATPEAQPGVQPGENAAIPDEPPVELKRLVIRNGAVRYKDGATRVEMNGLALSAENLLSRADAGIKLDFSLAVFDGDLSRMAGNLAVDARLRLDAAKLELKSMALTFTPVSGLLPKETGPLQLSLEGAGDLSKRRFAVRNCRLKSPQLNLSLTGEGGWQPVDFKGRLEGGAMLRKLAAMAGRNLGEGAGERLEFSMGFQLTDAVLALQKIAITAGKTPVGGDLRLALASPLSISGNIHAGRIVLDPWLSADGSCKAGKRSGAPETTSRAGKVQTNTAGTADAPSWPALDLGVDIAGIRREGLELKDIAFSVSGAKGRYVISGLKLALGSGGRVKGQANIDAPGRSYAVNAVASGVNVGGLLAALGKPRALDGTAGLEADLRTSGADVAALQRGLGGRGTLEVRNMRVPAMGSLSIPAIGGKKTVIPEYFDVVRMPFSARDGEISLRPIAVKSRGLNAAGQAQVSLPRQYMQSAVDIRIMGMTIPIVVKGPFSNVSVGVDPKFALDLARDLPGVLLEGGKGAGNLATEGARGTGSAVKKGLGGVGGVVRGLFGK